MMEMRNDRYGWSAYDNDDGLGPRLVIDDGADLGAVVASLEEHSRTAAAIAKYSSLDELSGRANGYSSRVAKELLRQAKALAKQLDAASRNHANGQHWAPPDLPRIEPVDFGLPSWPNEAASGPPALMPAAGGNLESLLHQLLQT